MKTPNLIATAVAALAATALLYSQSAAPFDVTQPTDKQPSHIDISGGVSGTWLVIDRANKTDNDPVGKGGFDPSYTYLISDFKPLVKKLRNGKWEIQFTAEIAENIP